MIFPKLKDRFLAPAGWRTHDFHNAKTGHNIHYGSVFPQKEEPPTAVVVCLPGLSEFAEKYYEVAHDMLDRGYAFFCIDWQYQGHSGRLKDFPHRRHSDGVDTDVNDLYRLMVDYVKPSAVHPDKGRIPLIMLGHSMGAQIGLRFLSEHPGFFDAAAFSAPFFGVKILSLGQQILAAIAPHLSRLIGNRYIPGGSDWHEAMRKGDGTDIFSSDPERDNIHGAWSQSDEKLRVGSVTYDWVIKAFESCEYMRDRSILENVNIPLLFALAGEERIVDNHATRKIAAFLSKCELIEIKGAKHEILMERDEYRNQFINAFDKMVQLNKIALLKNPGPF